MLDIRLLRERLDEVLAMMEQRGQDPEVARRAAALDERRRELLVQVEALRHRRRLASEEVAKIKRSGGDPSEQIAAVRETGDQLRALESHLRQVEEELQGAWLLVPNMPDPEVLAQGNEPVEVRAWGTPRKFSFEPLAHWDLGERLQILDWQSAARISGARFTVFRGRGARLERALINFMLDLHTQEHGYTEIIPPYLVSPETAMGSGSLPRLDEDMFRCREGYYLIPTAETPLSSLHKGEILAAEDLPLRYVAYTPCFRSEAGAAGRDTRGLIRQHQFDKVELFKFTKPEESASELESLVADAEAVLQRLGLPYRVMALGPADIAPQSAKTYDIELWAPGVQRWLEVSSCSNCRDYQARRTDTRYRPAPGAKPEFVHTLNGSGVALARLVVAILETYQNADGTVVLPEVLGPYMGGELVIEPA